MAKLGFFRYSKIDIFLHTQLEKASHAYFDWYLEPSKTGNDRATSSQETDKKLLETVSELKNAASTDFATSQV